MGRIFGVSAGERGAEVPTALIVRDAEPTTTYNAVLDGRLRAGQSIFESKSENSINRIDSSANPRTIERVPSGAVFAFEATYRIFAIDGDDSRSRADFPRVLEALALLELDTLGGHGSRGYGRVRFTNLSYADMQGKSVPISDGELKQYLLPAQNGG